MAEGVTVFASSDADFSLKDVVDLEVTPSVYLLELRKAGGAFQELASGPLALVPDGRGYTWTLHLKGDTAVIALPGGVSRSIKDARIATVSGASCTWEARSAGTSQSRIDALAAFTS